MELTEIYEKGEALLRQRDIGLLLDGVETGFILTHDRNVMDRYTFRQQCIGAEEASTRCHVLGVELATPVVMSAMTSPILVFTSCARSTAMNTVGSRLTERPCVAPDTTTTVPVWAIA